MKHSEWATPTQEEVRELEYTQLEENNGNGKGNNGTSVPVNSGILFAALVAFIFGLWKQSHTSQRST
jgi:GH24 family phage-related lysozyme (muramidase)